MQHLAQETTWASALLAEFALQELGAGERRVSAGASPAGLKLNLCQVVQVYVLRASEALHYQGDAGPVLPQLMGTWL